MKVLLVMVEEETFALSVDLPIITNLYYKKKNGTI